MKAPEAPLRVVLVEDSTQDAELLLRKLRRGGLHAEVQHAPDEAAFRAALEKPCDVVIADYTVPGLGAPKVLALLREHDADLPCIVVSGTVGEEVAVQTVQLGAADYLLKDRLARLPAAVRRAVEGRRRDTERRRAEQALRERERRLQAILDHAPAAIFLKDVDGRYLIANREFQKGLPEPSAAVVGRTDEQLFAGEQAAAYRANDLRVIAHGEALRLEEQFVTGDGQRTSVVVKFPLKDDTGRIYATGGIATDITDLKRAARETRLLRDAALSLGKAEGLTAGLQAVVEALCEASGWDFAQAWLRSGDGEHLVCSEAWHGVGPAAARFHEECRDRRFKPDQGLLGKVWTSQHPAQRVNLRAEPDFLRGEAARAAGYDAWAAVPVLSHGSTVAILEFFAAQASPANDELLHLATLVSVQIGPAIEQRRAIEERDRLFTLSRDLLCVIGFDGRLVQLNPAWESVLGWRPDGLRGVSWFDLVHPNDLGHARQEIGKLLDGQSIADLESRLRCANGGYRWIAWSASPSAVTGLVYGVGRDVTASREAEERFRATFNQAAVGIAHVDLESRFLRVNDKLCDIVGYSRAELLAMTFGEITYADDLRTSWRQINSLESGASRTAAFEKRYVRKDGRVIWVELTIALARNPSGGDEYFITVVQDITERKRIETSLREAEQRYRSLVEQSPDAIFLHAGGRVTYCNATGAVLIGADSPAQVVGRPMLDIVHPEYRELVRERIERLTLTGGAVPIVREAYLRLDGTRVDVEVGATLMSIDGEQVIQVVARDISERNRYEARIHYLATHDELTGLPNRSLLADRLRQALANARRSGQQIAVAMLDLDHFKFVNDSFGHRLGDRVLREVAQRLNAMVREGDTVARVGGDEFVLVLTGLAGRDGASAVLERLLASFEQPIAIDELQVFTTASVGASVFPQDTAGAEDGDLLLRNADAAMYQAKDEGRSQCRFFTRELSARATLRVETESALRRALARQEFVLHLQPQADLRDGRILGAEALIRWNDPKRGLVAPGAFIPVAEETGLIVPIGKWVLEEACRTAAAWTAAGLRGLRVSVNVSARQFKNGDLVDTVRAALRDAGLDAAALELEITESLVMDNAASFISTLRELRDIGVGLSIDDFGTGYSSLSYLKQFPIHKLKIDQSFVRDLPGDVDDAAIAKAVIDLGHSLGLRVIAEGVETPEQLEFLRARGCDEVQGYLICRPVPAADFIARLRDSTHAHETLARSS